VLAVGSMPDPSSSPQARQPAAKEEDPGLLPEAGGCPAERLRAGWRRRMMRPSRAASTMAGRSFFSTCVTFDSSFRGDPDPYWPGGPRGRRSRRCRGPSLHLVRLLRLAGLPSCSTGIAGETARAESCLPKIYTPSSESKEGLGVLRTENWTDFAVPRPGGPGK